MRILFQSRNDLCERIGGDTVQMFAYRDYLVRKGWSVDINHGFFDDLSPYDIVHIFDLEDPVRSYMQARNALRQSRPYIISPIYYPLDGIPGRYVGGSERVLRVLPAAVSERILVGHFKRKYGVARYIGFGTGKAALFGYVLDNAAGILPNSSAEREVLARRFGLPHEKISVVYNGVSKSELSKMSNAEGLPRIEKPYILCLGNIGPRKNQLNLVRALRKVDTPLVICGDPLPQTTAYYKKVRKEAGARTVFLGGVHRSEAIELIRNAFIVIQPSFVETPGLVALEALALGVKVIVSDIEPVREYFGTKAIYCNPYDTLSIRDAIIRTVDRRDAVPCEPRYWLENFEWNSVLPSYAFLLEQLAHVKS